MTTYPHDHARRARETAAILVGAFGPEHAARMLRDAYVPDRADRLYWYARLNRAALRDAIRAAGGAR